MKSATLTLPGFDSAPLGSLLDQFIDFDSKMGVAYERSCGFYKDFHIHDRLMLIFPRNASAMEVQTLNQVMYRVTSKSALLVPPNLTHDDKATSTIYDTLALYPEKSLVQSVAYSLGWKASDLDHLYNNCVSIGRSHFLEQLLQEYFYERVLLRNNQPSLLNALEQLILKDVLSCLAHASDRASASRAANLKSRPKIVSAAEDPVEKALKYIESNLFSSLEVADIARFGGLSISTLNRRLRDIVGTTAYAYIKRRRAEEARKLLEEGSRQIGEIALLVGYENFGAFSEAFKSVYGQPPSAYLKSQNK